MTEQEKREKVIKGLECCLDAMVQSEHAIAEDGVVMSSWQDRAKRIDAVREAIAFLKAQEPRVMTLGELVVDDVVWLEDCDKETTVPGIYCNRNDTNTVFASRMKGYLFVRNDEYGKRWRCWTSRPTDEQREKEPWNG